MDSKRKNEDVDALNADEESDDDDDFGPAPATEADVQAALSQTTDKQPARKRTRKLEFERVYLDNLPNAECYERSLMHRDVVTHVVVSKPTEFIVTASIDGHVKFWKKMPKTIEFAKHFQAHLGAINAMVLSPDGLRLVTTSQDKMVKFFEVVSFDMVNMIAVSFTPTCACWLPGGLRVAVADAASGAIFVFKGDDARSDPLYELNIHQSPVVAMALCPGAARTIVSCDKAGMIEYWDGDSFEMPSGDHISFQMKSSTDLYDLAKAKTHACCISFAPNGSLFAVMAKDKQIRIFDFRFVTT
jgi:peptidylprolyl isomerase domain and WD repeat-containing protein 1